MKAEKAKIDAEVKRRIAEEKKKLVYSYLAFAIGLFSFTGLTVSQENLENEPYFRRIKESLQYSRNFL